jgi:hypothetical protein
MGRVIREGEEKREGERGWRDEGESHKREKER